MLVDADDCEIVGEANGSAEMERLLIESAPEVVLCDTSPADALRVIEALSGEGAALVLLGEDHSEYQLMADAVLPGWAYLRKEADRIEILGAIRAAGAGLIAVDRSFSLLPGSAFPLADAEILPPDETLTAREREVLQQMTHGLPNKQIAARLNISQHTVKFHVASILAKLGASSRTEAVTSGARRGLVSL
ncbi:uncharacterized protein KY384_000091 [Bacidia gigantensis]|uniref:uncharacterized protein n=1 Tax=Bacidia gigantensis TaxID=2732470 RepID=UPI001D037180|nr:uncharacterized protein KY384_000091 [Bacidia gigantensis]KAG8526098.1 hypothetical protein KY384_000091 [Bacidia gigantensis]